MGKRGPKKGEGKGGRPIKTDADDPIAALNRLNKRLSRARKEGDAKKAAQATLDIVNLKTEIKRRWWKT